MIERDGHTRRDWITIEAFETGYCKILGWKLCYYGLVQRPVYWYLESLYLS